MPVQSRQPAGRSRPDGAPTQAQVRRLAAARVVLRDAPHRIAVAQICTEAARELVSAERTALVLRMAEGPRIALEDPPGTGTLEGWGPVIEQAPWERSRGRRTLIRQDPLGMYEDMALLTAPVLARGRVTGAVLARRPAAHPFTAGDVEALARLGRLVGSALDILIRRTQQGATGDTDVAIGVPSDERVLADVRAALASDSSAPRLALAVFGVDRIAQVRGIGGPGPAAEVLGQAVLALRAQLRAGDVLYRLGHDELAVLLPGTGSAEVGLVATRLHRALAGAVPGVVGVGWAVVRRESPASVVREAREAMDGDRERRRRVRV